MLNVFDLHVHYGRVPAVRGVTFRVGRGEIVCVIGPNGAGKSTTLATIAGLTRPVEGEVRLNGASLIGLQPEAIARRGVSLVPEGRHVFAKLTVKENILIGTGMRRDRQGIKEDFDWALAHFPILRERLSTLAGKLSGGEQQQLVIARALLTRPTIMLIDEPSLGLAPLIVDKVYQILLGLRDRGVTFLIVEQSAHRALDSADRIYVLREGRIQFHGPANELSEDVLEHAYFGFHDVDSDAPGAMQGRTPDH